MLSNEYLLYQVEDKLHARWIGARMPDEKPKLKGVEDNYRLRQKVNTPLILTGAIQCTIFIKNAKRVVHSPDCMPFDALAKPAQEYIAAGYFLEVRWLRLASVLAQVTRILEDQYPLSFVFPDLLSLIPSPPAFEEPPPPPKRWPAPLRTKANRDMKNEIRHANGMFTELLLLPDSPSIEERGKTWNILIPVPALRV